MGEIPAPAKRKAFTARDVAAVFIKHDGRCSACSEKVALGAYQIDHITPIDLLGAHELENWQLLCVPCHKLKTAEDITRIAKTRRLRGETGQAKRRAERGGSSIKGRGFSKRPDGATSWPKRSFGRKS